MPDPTFSWDRFLIGAVLAIPIGIAVGYLLAAAQEAGIL